MSTFLLDTNILSEFSRRRPDPRVLSWYGGVPPTDVRLSVLTLGEVERGIERQRSRNGEHAARLAAWLDDVLRVYSDRVVPFDLEAARCWGRLVQRAGHDGVDVQIAATALTRGMTVATRNTKHFAPLGVPVVDPFEA